MFFRYSWISDSLNLIERPVGPSLMGAGMFPDLTRRRIVDGERAVSSTTSATVINFSCGVSAIHPPDASCVGRSILHVVFRKHRRWKCLFWANLKNNFHYKNRGLRYNPS
jgi:hypothetical protein